MARNRHEEAEPVAVDGIPSCVIQLRSRSFTALLTYIFKLWASGETVPSLEKQNNAVPFFEKEDNSTLVSNYEPKYLHNIFPSDF
jgi:hypothetical protein